MNTHSVDRAPIILRSNRVIRNILILISVPPVDEGFESRSACLEIQFATGGQQRIADGLCLEPMGSEPPEQPIICVYLHSLCLHRVAISRLSIGSAGHDQAMQTFEPPRTSFRRHKPAREP